MWLGLKKNTETLQKSPAHRHKAAHCQGGFNLSYGEESSEIQKATASILKQIGTKIISGNFGSLLQISKPVSMCTQTSFLHGIAHGNTYCYLLDQCYDMSVIEQMKYVCTYYIAGLHVDSEIIKMKAPLDPLVGETLQLISPDGASFYAEQINFDPPISQYYLLGKNYKIFGKDHLEINIHKTVNSLTGIQKGSFTISFNNGAEFKCTKTPLMELTGLMMGDRILNWSGKAQIDGPKIRAVINFNFNPEGMMSKLTSFFKSQESTKLHDIVEVDIYELDANGNQLKQKWSNILSLICQGIGSWLEGLLFDDRIYWQLNENKPKWQVPSDILLSDTSKREDLQYMQQQSMADAQRYLKVIFRAKLSLEAQNLRDIQLRK